uniref:Rhomboid protein n=1 Tax=Kalanchoe fedtschenkoi TaxID=63787 RepID=A0A7N0R9G9_KALFE
MSFPSPSAAGGGFFSGFTRLCKGLSGVLVGGYALLSILPPLVQYLALVPDRTIPFAWNILTAGYVEQSVFGLVVSIVGLLFMGKVLEPIWGSREFFKFVIIVNLMTYVSVFTTAIALYYITRKEIFLYTPISGFHGVLSGFLVGVKQIIPDQELSLFSLRIKSKWLPSLVVLSSIVTSLFTLNSVAYLPVLIFGTYTSWIYLRYFQRRPETNVSGDSSDDFAFSTFFPQFMRPVIDPVASIFDRLLCGKSSTSTEAAGYVVGGAPLSGLDSIDASRRRERGARALEERLAAERSVPLVSLEASPKTASDFV